VFVNVIVDISYEKLDRAFQYAVPANLEHLIEVGMRVNVPFGRGNKLIEAYVIEITDICNYNPKINIVTSVKKFMDANINKYLKEMLEKDIFATDIYTLGYEYDSWANLDYTNKIVVV